MAPFKTIRIPGEKTWARRELWWVCTRSLTQVIIDPRQQGTWASWTCCVYSQSLIPPRGSGNEMMGVVLYMIECHTLSAPPSLLAGILSSCSPLIYPWSTLSFLFLFHRHSSHTAVGILLLFCFSKSSHLMYQRNSTVSYSPPKAQCNWGENHTMCIYWCCMLA